MKNGQVVPLFIKICWFFFSPLIIVAILVFKIYDYFDTKLQLRSWNAEKVHWVKGVRIWSFLVRISHIRTKYGDILRINPYSARMRENTGQKNSEYGHFSRDGKVLMFLSDILLNIHCWLFRTLSSIYHEAYSTLHVSLRIQSRYGKIRTRKTLNTKLFYVAIVLYFISGNILDCIYDMGELLCSVIMSTRFTPLTHWTGSNDNEKAYRKSGNSRTSWNLFIVVFFSPRVFLKILILKYWRKIFFFEILFSVSPT